MNAIAYPLEQLFVDQDRDWVMDTVAAVMAWVPGTSQTPGALRGVETAGRRRGGRSAFKAVRNGSPGQAGKAATLVARPDLIEVHLSLWCASPRISIMEQLKP